MSNLFSGVSSVDPAGKLHPLTFAELAKIVHEVEIHPELFLDVQGQMVFEFDRFTIGGGKYAEKVYEFTVEALESEKAERYQLPANQTLDTMSKRDLDCYKLAMYIRIQAADELLTKAWIQTIISQSHYDTEFLQALGEYCCSAPLVFSKRFNGLVFGRKAARKALEPLLYMR